MARHDDIQKVLADLNWFGNRQDIARARAIAEAALQAFQIQVWEQEWRVLVMALAVLVSAALLAAIFGDADEATLVLQVGTPFLGMAAIRWIYRDPRRVTDLACENNRR